MAGGSSAGAISYPDWMVDIQNNWLGGNALTDHDQDTTYCINDLINTAHTNDGNPYYDESPFDPNAALSLVANSPLKRASDQFDAANTAVSALAYTDWNDFIDAVLDKLGSAAYLADLKSSLGNMVEAINTELNISDFTALVTAFETRKKTRFLREVSQWTAGMADLNAVHTSSFVIGMALRQKEFADAVDDFDKNLTVTLYNTVLASLMQNYSAMTLQIPNAFLEFKKSVAGMKNQLAELKSKVEQLIIVSMSEENQERIRLDVQDAKWDMEALLYGPRVMGGISGASPVTDQDKGKASPLSGALAGASAGASFGPIGAGVGALGGAIMSAF